MRSPLRAIIYAHVIAHVLAGCKQWVMKLPQAIHKYPFVRVISVRLVNPLDPVPVANLKACHAVCDKAGCKAFAFYYDQLLCSIAESYEEDGPRILTPDEVQGDQQLGFYVAAPHDQEKLPYCPSREAYARYLQDSVMPWLFPDNKLPTTPALPIAASSSSSASPSTPLSSTSKDTTPTTPGRTTTASSSSSTTTTPSGVSSGEVPTTATSTSFAPSPSAPTTSGSSSTSTSTSTTRSKTSTTAASTSHTHSFSGTTPEASSSSSSKSSAQQKTPDSGTTVVSEMEPVNVTAQTTPSQTTEGSFSSTKSSTSTTTTTELPRTTSRAQKTDCSVSMNGWLWSGNEGEVVGFQTKDGVIAFDSEAQNVKKFVSQYISDRLYVLTRSSCFVEVGFEYKESMRYSSNDKDKFDYSVNGKGAKYALCTCTSDDQVGPPTTTPDDTIYAGYVMVGHRRYDVATDIDYKDLYMGLDKTAVSVMVFPSCEITLEMAVDQKPTVSLTYYPSENNGELVSRLEDVDFTDIKSVAGRCTH